LSWLNDFWSWDQLTDTWTQMANFPGAARREASAFSIGNMGYMGMGSGIGAYFTDFYQYNPATNTWLQKAPYSGGPREEATQFSIGAFGYVGTGYNGATAGVMTNDFWEYHPEDSTTGLQNLTTEFVQLQIGPNPFNDETIISFNEQLLKDNVSVFVFDSKGKKVYEQTVGDKRFVLKRNGLASGVYLVKLIVSGDVVGELKCVAL